MANLIRLISAKSQSHNGNKSFRHQRAFSEEKVVRSLSQSGLTVDTASQTVDYLKRHLKDEITTGDIYSHVSDYLHKNAPTENYFNYGLKRAVMDMGPSGFPFEILVSELLKKNGFKTEVGVVTQQMCHSRN